MGVGQEALEGMPEPVGLRLSAGDGQHLVSCGRMLLYRYDADDVGMRNLAIVALTDAGRRVDEVAAVFGLTATYVSMLRGRARRDGSAGLVRRRGRPPRLTGRQVARARAWAGSGWTQQAIADRLGVARSVISELLARLGPAPVQEALLPACDTEPTETEPTGTEPGDTEPTGTEPGDTEPADTEPADSRTGGQPNLRMPNRRMSPGRPGSRPVATGAGMPGRCCCIRSWTWSGRRAS